MLIYSITHHKSINPETMMQITTFLEKHQHEFVPPLDSRATFGSTLQRIEKNGGAFFVTSKDELVSLVTYERTRKGIHIPFIVTAKDERRKGRMKAALCTALDEFGDTQTYLETWSTNIAARNLFEKIGFTLERFKRNSRGNGIHELGFMKR